MNFVRAYLRASTKEQDAERAKQALIDFAESLNLNICNFYIENESGATLERTELLKLINDAQDGDILLIEDIDRLSRLNNSDWEELKRMLQEKDLRIVAMNIPTTWQQANTNNEFENRLFSAINNVIIEILAASARRDYEQRRERQAQGIEKAKKENKYQNVGRKPDIDKYKAIIKLLDNHSWKEIRTLLHCSPSTIKRAKEWHENENKKQ